MILLGASVIFQAGARGNSVQTVGARHYARLGTTKTHRRQLEFCVKWLAPTVFSIWIKWRSIVLEYLPFSKRIQARFVGELPNIFYVEENCWLNVNNISIHLKRSYCYKFCISQRGNAKSFRVYNKNSIFMEFLESRISHLLSLTVSSVIDRRVVVC